MLFNGIIFSEINFFVSCFFVRLRNVLSFLGNSSYLVRNIFSVILSKTQASLEAVTSKPNCERVCGCLSKMKLFSFHVSSRIN